MKSVPFLPEIADGAALEDRNNNERKAPECCKQDCTPQQTLNSSAGKHPNVEEGQRELQKHDLREVQRGHYVKKLEHFGDLRRPQCPDILAKAMLDGSIYCDHSTGQGRDESSEHGPVVVSNVEPGNQDLVRKPNNNKGGSHDDHYVRQYDIVLPTITNRSSTVDQADVFGGYAALLVRSFRSKARACVRTQCFRNRAVESDTVCDNGLKMFICADTLLACWGAGVCCTESASKTLLLAQVSACDHEVKFRNTHCTRRKFGCLGRLSRRRPRQTYPA